HSLPTKQVRWMSSGGGAAASRRASFCSRDRGHVKHPSPRGRAHASNFPRPFTRLDVAGIAACATLAGCGEGGLVGIEAARPTNAGLFSLRFRGRDKVRSFRCVAALMLAAFLVFPVGALAQVGKGYQPGAGAVLAQAKRPGPPLPARGHAALTDKLNQ